MSVKGYTNIPIHYTTIRQNEHRIEFSFVKDNNLKTQHFLYQNTISKICQSCEMRKRPELANIQLD